MREEFILPRAKKRRGGHGTRNTQDEDAAQLGITSSAEKSGGRVCDEVEMMEMICEVGATSVLRKTTRGVRLAWVGQDRGKE